MCLPCNGDLPFLHDLQQGTLNFGGCAVNFVSQQQVGKDGPQNGTELTGLLIENSGANQVGGQQVRRELNAAELAV